LPDAGWPAMADDDRGNPKVCLSSGEPCGQWRRGRDGPSQTRGVVARVRDGINATRRLDPSDHAHCQGGTSHSRSHPITDRGAPHSGRRVVGRAGSLRRRQRAKGNRAISKETGIPGATVSRKTQNCSPKKGNKPLGSPALIGRTLSGKGNQGGTSNIANRHARNAL
jgi:hypothetical protein